MRKYWMECLGTMFLVLTVSLTGTPIAIGTMFAALIYLGAHISGANYNPAISLAMWVRGKLSLKDMWLYMGFQILGGFFAAGIYWVLAGQRYFPLPPAGVVYWQHLIIEVLFTFLLAYTMLTVLTTKKLKGNYIYGLAIGLALLAIAFLGGTYNPAVSAGPALFDALFNGIAYQSLPTYLLGTLTGGLFAGLAYRYFNPEEFKTKTTRARKK